MRAKQTPREYAAQRANETGRTYLAQIRPGGEEGLALLNCAQNRRVALETWPGATLEFFRPKRKRGLTSGQPLT